MSLIAFFGALESGLIYALVALGVLISFRVLNFPDLTADGSFPLGGAVAAVAIIAGVNPWLACVFACAAGFAAGALTAWLHLAFGILHLLAGILVMTALYSINLRIMGAPNISLLGYDTIFSQFLPFLSNYPNASIWLKVLTVFLIVILVKILLDTFFATQIGLSMRAVGANARMSEANGINGKHITLLGMAISNALIAGAGAIFVQTQGGADVSIGIGTIIIGLAGVIIGQTVLPARRMAYISLAVIIGAVLYRLLVQVALSSQTLRNLGVKSQDLNLITTMLVILALAISAHKSKWLPKVLKRSV